MSTPEIIKDSIAPLVQRILSDPLHFKSSKRTEIVSNTPNSYIKIGNSVSKSKAVERTQQQPLSINSSSSEKSKSSGMAKARPTSLAQAIAGYTGKRLAEDTTAKGKKLRKINKLQKQQQLASESESQDNEDLGEDLELIDEDDISPSEDDEGSKLGASQQDTTTSPSATPESDKDDTYNEEDVSSSSDDDTNYTDAEADLTIATPHNIISKKVYQKYQLENSSGNDSETSKNDSDSEEQPQLKKGAVPIQDEDDEDDDEEDDGDYEDEDNDEEEASEEEASDEEDEDHEDDDEQEANDDSENEVITKKDLLAEKSEALSTTGTTTPPTSPESDEESDASKTKGITGLKTSEFFGIEESPADRGSNNSSRIVKNWGPKFSARKPLGLLNHGVTCYTNAAVQAMIHIPAIQHYLNDILLNKYKDTIGPRSVSQVLAETSARMWGLESKFPKKGGPKFINPKKLIGRLDDINCMMSDWQQEDSHEYFMSLMSRLQEDGTPKGKKLNENIIYDIFGGLLDQFVTCKSCGHVSKTQQEFYDLSLHLGSSRKNSQTESDSLSEEAAAESKHRYSINKSIRDFFSPELIKPDRTDKKSGYVCEKCKQRTNAVKISTIDRAPETLAVHLKRFKLTGNTYSKVKQAVSYPLILDLSQYTTNSEPALYQLISVVVHEGRSVSSGHYVAHCRQPDGVWATFDDEYINTIPEKQALRDPSAYYMIYTRLTHKDIAQSQTPIFKKMNNTNGNKSQNSPSTSSPSESNSPIKNKMKSLRVGIATPSKSTQMTSSPVVSPSPNNKKTKIRGITPTNNLGNLGGKGQKRYTKDHGNGNSKRFKRY